MNNSNGFFRQKSRPLILGHRGVPLHHQENTMAAFRKAAELGLDGVEFDVFLTADDKVVVFHDEDISRLTGCPGNITQMTWDEISRLRVQKTFDRGDGTVVTYPFEQRIPLLEEVLMEFKGKLLMDIEMKAYAPQWSRRHTGTEVARVIRKCQAQDSVVVTSFDFFMLHYLEREYPGLHSGFAYDDSMLPGTISEWFRWVPEIRSELAKAPGNQNDISFLNFLLEADTIGDLIGSTVVNAEYSLLDSDTIDKFHARQMLVGSYTLFPVDTRFVREGAETQLQVLERLKNEQVDWIETDDPERAMQLLG